MIQKLCDQTIKRFTKGKSLEEVFDAYYPDLLYFASRLTGDQQEAEDITIVMFNKLFEKHASFNSEANIKAFLYISVRNSCLNFLQSRQWQGKKIEQWQKDTHSEDLIINNIEIESEVVDQLRREIENLPNKCKEILKMYFFEELKPDQIAVMLKISVDTVYSQKRRGLHLLKLKLESQNLQAAILLLSLLECYTGTFLKKTSMPFADSGDSFCFYIQEPISNYDVNPSSYGSGAKRPNNTTDYPVFTRSGYCATVK